MKLLRLFLICLACFGVCAAQGGASSSPRTPPGLVVVSQKWERHLLPHINTDKTEFDVTRGSASDPDMLNNPVLAGSRRYRPERLSFAYRYTAGVRNDGAKRIEGLVWEYVASDPASGKDLGRRRFYSLDKINAGEARKLRARSHFPPSPTVKAEAGAKHPAFDERVEFGCVMYSDGSLWRSPSMPESVCLELKDPRKMRRRLGSQ